MQTLCELRCNIVIFSSLVPLNVFISSNHIVWLIMHNFLITILNKFPKYKYLILNFRDCTLTIVHSNDHIAPSHTLLKWRTIGTNSSNLHPRIAI